MAIYTLTISRTLWCVVLGLAWVSNPVLSYPDGASSKACGHLTPGHGIAQLSPSPYNIEITTDTYRAGAIIPVTIIGPPYAGFILQAQIVSTRTVVGTWADPPINTKIMKCSRNKDTMTHSSTMAKHHAIYRWIAPDYDVHLVEFIATVAPSKETWWRSIKSSTMTFDPKPVTPPIPTFPPSIVPYTQDFALAFPFQTRSPDAVDNNDYNSYNEIDKNPITPEVNHATAKLPIINIPETPNFPDSGEDKNDIYKTPKVTSPHFLPELPPFPQKPDKPDFPEIVPDAIEPTTSRPSYFGNSQEQNGPSYESANDDVNDEYKAEDPQSHKPTHPPEVNIEPIGGVTDTLINITPDHKVNDNEITRDEGAEFPSRINTDGSEYQHKRRRPYRRPRPPPEPWQGPGPDGHVFFHPWQRFSGWHGPRYRHWQRGSGYQSWPFMPTGRSAVDVPGIYEYRYYYKR